MGRKALTARGWVRGAGLAAMLALGGCERPAQGAADIPHTPIPKVEPRFWMQSREGQIEYQGVVADEATRASVTSALQATAGASGKLEVDSRTLPAPWASALGPAADALRPTGGRLDFTARRIELRGDLDPEQRATLHAQLTRLYPGYTLAGAFAGVDPRLALPAAGDQQALLAFLNAAPPSFHPDSGMLSEGGVEAVTRAVRGLQAAGPAARVEASIYPDATPSDDTGSALARQRSEALLTQFALRGMGPPQIVVRPGAFAKGREGQVEFAAPTPPSTTAQP